MPHQTPTRRLPTALAPDAVPEGGRASTARRVTAPFAGVVVPTVRPGDRVPAGGVVATIEAIKLEAAVTVPVAGTVTRLAVDAYAHVEGGDVLVELS